MATSNQLDIEIPPAVILDVTTKLQQIRTALSPYLFTLTEEQRRVIPKMGDKTLAFVSKTVDYTNSNPEFTPSYLLKQELDDDFNAVSSLSPINNLLDQLQSDVDDTMMIAGSEAYVQSLIYYNAVRNAAATGQTAAKPIYDDLSNRFPGRPPKKKP